MACAPGRRPPRRDRAAGSLQPLLGFELVVGPHVAFGEQVGDADRADAVALTDDDLEGGEVVEEHLTAPAARRNDATVAVAYGDDGVQFIGALGGCRNSTPSRRSTAIPT